MNFSSKNDDYLTIDQATKLLKEGYVLLSYKDDLRYIFIFEEHRIVVKSVKFSFKLTINDFKANFKDFKFSLIKDENEEINLNKDLDYYKNIQKKQ